MTPDDPEAKEGGVMTWHTTIHAPILDTDSALKVMPGAPMGLVRSAEGSDTPEPVVGYAPMDAAGWLAG